MPERAIRPLVIRGKVVTFDDDSRVLENGAVYIRPNDPVNRGRIEAVKGADEAAPSGFGEAPVVSTDGVIYPGLIDLHNHVAYNCMSLWLPAKPPPDGYGTHEDWTRDEGYDPEVQNPTNALCKVVGKALLKYVETKAIVGGVTAIQGSTKQGLGRPYEGWLVRNVEFETFGMKKKTVFQSTLQLHDETEWTGAREHLDEGNAFIYHVAEGRDHDRLVGEYQSVRDHHCLAPTLVAIHTNALGQVEYGEWAPHGGSIVWSPFSNLWLYGDTAKVDIAAQTGLRICLGADWSPSGSKNLLGELKVADMWNRERLGGHFSAEQLCRMATSNPADAVNWGAELGRLAPGRHGDVLITTAREPDPYRNLIAAIERDVLFVAINGEPFYGTTPMMRAAEAQQDEPIRVGRLSRRIVLVYPGIPDADMGWERVLEAIRTARRDPQAARARSEAEAGDGGPLELRPDKPSDRGKRVPLSEATKGRIDSLTHDAAYFQTIARATIHHRQLDGLRDYYPTG